MKSILSRRVVGAVLLVGALGVGWYVGTSSPSKSLTAAVDGGVQSTGTAGSMKSAWPQPTPRLSAEQLLRQQMPPGLVSIAGQEPLRTTLPEKQFNYIAAVQKEQHARAQPYVGELRQQFRGVRAQLRGTGSGGGADGDKGTSQKKIRAAKDEFHHAKHELRLRGMDGGAEPLRKKLQPSSN